MLATVETQNSQINAVEELPIEFTEESPSHVIMLGDKPVTITLTTGERDSQPRISTRANIVFNEVGPFTTKAPHLYAQGKYNKYFSKLPQFNDLPPYQYILMRFNEYRFEIDLPKEAALDGAYELKAITDQGFAKENPNYKGCTLVEKISHATGYKLIFKFYIQAGAAFDLAGRQLCPDREWPISGTSVRYNYWYYVKANI